MSVQTHSGLAGGSLGGNQHPREFGAPAGRNAVQSGKRPFSQLFNLAASGLRKFVYRRPDTPTSGHPASAESSLQGPLQALQRSKAFAMARFSQGGDSGCVLCAADHEDAVRLCQIVGMLPIGQKVQFPVFGKILGVRFKTLSADLNFLIHQLRLPIKGRASGGGIILTEPLRLCKSCALIGEQLRQTETFQKQFRAALPGSGRENGCRVLSATGQVGPPVTSPSSG